MRKVALVFVLAVILPSLVLAWLAVRSLRDQEYAMERQQSLLYQGVADSLARDIAGRLADRQTEFGAQVEQLLKDTTPLELAPRFDARIRHQWPLADVGFAVSLSGTLFSPAPTSRPEARLFCLDNGGFLGNREIAEVYGNVAYNTAGGPAGKNVFQTWNSQVPAPQQAPSSLAPYDEAQPQTQAPQTQVSLGKAQSRKVNPVQQINLQQQAAVPPSELNFSKLVPAEAEFGQLIGTATDGMLARFLQNKLKVMFWHRAKADSNLVFGAQLDLRRLVRDLAPIVHVDAMLQQDVCVAVLDDNARPAVVSQPGFQANWKRPFVASEISEALPHWEVGVYLLHPEALAQAARMAKLTLGLLIALLVLAIGVGSWLIVADLNRQLRLTRQKTDFVSNVSHELKTPLTSIRMFSELLADGKVTDREKQRSYLQIISAESARLTRLINNVLDFARLDRGEKKYDFRRSDFVELVTETVTAYQPHLESSGFTLDFHPPGKPIPVRCDRDAIAQVIVNLLSNAEKYSNGAREISVRMAPLSDAARSAEVQVLDRGPGIPRGAEEKIFDQFYRVNDSLNSGVQGSGLGLTLARQIARAHGGDVTYQPRDSGGSCFSLRLPILATADVPRRADDGPSETGTSRSP